MTPEDQSKQDDLVLHEAYKNYVKKGVNVVVLSPNFRLARFAFELIATRYRHEKAFPDKLDIWFHGDKRMIFRSVTMTPERLLSMIVDNVKIVEHLQPLDSLSNENVRLRFHHAIACVNSLCSMENS